MNKLDKEIKEELKQISIDWYEIDAGDGLCRISDEEIDHLTNYIKNKIKAALEASKLEEDCYEAGTDLSLGNRKHIQNGFNLAVKTQHKIIKELKNEENKTVKV